MLKDERQDLIVELVNSENIIEVSDLTSALNVTEMTIRRDLKDLEEKGLLKRIHGGAKKVRNLSNVEYSNTEKKQKNINQKKYISKKISEILVDDEIIFMGPGTTMEYVSEYIDGKHLTIFTNSLYLFNELIKIDSLTVRLIGGKYRKITGAFVGPLAIDMIKDLRFQKAFIGVNGISQNNAYAYNEDEGFLQKIILDNSSEKFIVADSSKIGIEDFYSFYKIEDVSVITDDKITKQDFKGLSKYTRVIKWVKPYLAEDTNHESRNYWSGRARKNRLR